MMIKKIATTWLLGLLLAGGVAFAEGEEAQVAPMVGHIMQPEEREPSEELMQSLQLPEGFEITIFAEGLGNPRKLAIAEDGTVYVTRRSEGDVLMLRDSNGDGRADEQETVASGIDHINGIIIHEGQLYLGPPTEILVADIAEDGTVSEPRVFVDGLPDGGQHPNRTLAFGPDGMFYVSVGSSCNACDESNPEHATMLRFEADGSGRTVFAEGLRNTIGFGWHPETGEFWGMDHGSDWRGDDQPPEEFNRLEQGEHYGWPFCFADQQVDIYLPADPEDSSKEEFCPTTAPPVLTYQAHSSPLALVFYTGEQFPEEYRGDAFVTMRGSWNRLPAVGYKVVRIRFEDGQPAEFEDFVSGFLIEDGLAQFGRPTGMAQAPDGSLFFTDDTGGVIYRVAYIGNTQ
ncbi:MAG: PQQ-dependent sugar dehydrogenase [Deinococcota bacterium]|jgi:glucose/arabinose dehydrogenase|nr:PQQ-dependent sugar dehydrogenase [Deinococcota bacterium]